MAPLTPRGFGATDWPSLDDLFDFRSNGVVTYRDHFAYAFSPEVLRRRVELWLRGSLTKEARERFHETRDRKAAPAHATTFDPSALQRTMYRPLDRRYLYNREEFVNQPRQPLQDVWGESNCALHALNDGTGGGPAAWCHGLLPDQHAFNNRGGWIFPLFDARESRTTLNGTAAGLSSAYGVELEPQQIFDAILALLSATDYTTRFAFDLDSDLPHIPFPSNEELFLAAARLGGRIRELETFASAPAQEFTFARLDGSAAPTLQVPTRSRAFRPAEAGGQIALAADWSFFISAVSETAWNFEVSGYPVLHHWLRARNGETVDALLQREILDVVGRIEELLHLFDEAVPLLERAISMSLSKDVLNGGGA